MHITSRLPNVGTTIFTIMSGLANQHSAINLGQGFPDYQMSEALINKVNEVMRKGWNQYVPMQGYMPLRESIAEKVDFLYGANVSPNTQVTITPGGTYAIYTALTTILQPGDEVIVFEPAYDSYIPNIEINGAVPVLISLKFPDYKIDWEDVRKKISPKTKAIIINSPHNPTGSVLSEKDMDELRSVVRNTNIFIVSDEVYEHLIYDNIPHQSILRYPDLLERSFVCFSFGKTYNCTGWKLGYCISSSELMVEFRKVHQFNCFSCHTPSQVALADFLKNKNEYLSLAGIMQKKRDYFFRLMKQTKFDLLPSHGSYFVCARYSRISNEGDKDFAIRITKEYGIASIPVSAFYKSGTDNNVLRFCFCKKNETLDAAVERLAIIL
ncbi:MAG: aminotransferase class I/II-fold pyridoxal phosphate-dependent enzyme [Bacteroidetes bacterium]|nr:aminotransferase class I/II-fold pyridoxal phosphate-dependent enzyme [Bacteroidota bacterium]MBS1929856.1 aminotransferase class I/II-fold pyridoxal phosphate-dependent enzyme [Bacteroidota bacterium]